MADTESFLKIKDIEGECEKDKHKKEIELASWAWSSFNSGAMGEVKTTCGKGSMSPMSFSSSCSKASPKLFLWCALGTYIPDAVIATRRSGGAGAQEEYFTITLKDVFVTAYSTAGDFENFTLSFNEAEFNYLPQTAAAKAGGKVVHKFTLNTGVGS